MSWVSKTARKLKKSVKKAIGNKAWNFLHSAANVATLGMNDVVFNAYNRNKQIIDPILGGIALGLVTGGLGGAAIGATGLGGMTAAGAAASGAATGAVAGGVSGAGVGMQQKATEEALEEQEKIQREAQQRQEQLARFNALKEAAGTPSEQSSLNFLAYSRRPSQIQKTRVSRNSGKTVGGSSSTIG